MKTSSFEFLGYINHLLFIVELLFLLIFANTNMTVLKFVSIGSYLMVLFFLSSLFEKQGYELESNSEDETETSESCSDFSEDENRNDNIYPIPKKQLSNKKRKTSSKISDNYFLFLKISFIVFTFISIALFAFHMIKKTNLNNSFGGTIGYIVFLVVLFIFLILSFFVDIIKNKFKEGFDSLLTKLLEYLSWEHFEKFNWYSHTEVCIEKYNEKLIVHQVFETNPIFTSGQNQMMEGSAPPYQRLLKHTMKPIKYTLSLKDDSDDKDFNLYSNSTDGIKVHNDFNDSKKKECIQDNNGNDTIFSFADPSGGLQRVNNYSEKDQPLSVNNITSKSKDTDSDNSMFDRDGISIDF
jgi:hypothetical protein